VKTPIIRRQGKKKNFPMSFYRKERRDQAETPLKGLKILSVGRENGTHFPFGEERVEGHTAAEGRKKGGEPFALNSIWLGGEEEEDLLRGKRIL